jgi:TonB family protein
MTGSISKSLRSGLICGALLSMACCGPFLLAGDDYLTRQAPVSIPESAAGLQLQLEEILRASEAGKPADFDNLVSELRIPESSAWFTANFGAEYGPKLAEVYKNSWPSYKGEIADHLHILGSNKHILHVRVDVVSASSTTSQASFIGTILQNADGPLTLYIATAKKGREIDALAGVYVYILGRFRVVNWGTFYGLPNVRPMRIRVSTEIAQAQLIRQVNPAYPEEARRQQVRGSVMLHGIIDRDGKVASAQAVSGPAELGKAAVEAVKQWEFRPTLLNGDPVEVDTTLTITFSSAH